MDNYQFTSNPPLVQTEGQEDLNEFFDFSSAAAEPPVYDTGVGGTIPDFGPGQAGYQPGTLDALAALGGQAPESTSFDCTLWNPIRQHFIGCSFSQKPTPVSFGNLYFPFATSVAPCDTDGVSFDCTLPELPILSNYGDQAEANVFEHSSETPAQLEMPASNGYTKDQAATATGGQAVVQSSPPFSSQLMLCGLDGCQMNFSIKQKLEEHQRFHAKHHWVVSESPFICECGQQCAKLDTLRRHIRRFQSSSCAFVCQELGCSSVFQRKDHLVQHLRHGHKYSDAEVQAKFPAREAIMNVKPVCHFTSCPYYRDAGFRDQPLTWQDENKPFTKQADYTKHMRDVHDWSPYPCDVPSCDKKDKKGYFNQKALQKHRKDQHPEAEPLAVKSPSAKRLPCGLPGCHLKLRPGSLLYHRVSCSLRSDEERAFANKQYRHLS